MDQYYCASPPSYSQGMNKYWIPHKDIHKKVIMTHIQFYLGSDATVRSYTKDGEDGFLITTPGECLTDEQIDDLCIKSMEMWERQAAARSLTADGTCSSSSTSPKMPLKRPLHQPVVIARAGGRRPSTHSHRSSSSSSSSSHHHHHSRHNHGHSYSRQQQYLQYPQQQHQQRQLPRTQQQQQEQQQPAAQQRPGSQHQQQQQKAFYAQPHHYHPRPSSAQSQRAVHPYHTGWEPLSPAHDRTVPEVERLY